MKLAFICFYEAYPPISGAASVSYNIAKYSTGEKILIQMSQEDGQQQISDNLTLISIKGPSESGWKKIIRINKVISKIVKNIAEIVPDVVVLEGASWVMYHWMLFRQIKKRMPKIKIVYHSHNVEYLLRKGKHGCLVCILTKWAESNIIHHADMAFAVSAVDSTQFESLYSIQPKILPNGVDIEKFDKVTEDEIRATKQKYGLDDNTVLFMGLYLYKPNRDGVDFLVKTVMPKVLERCQNAKLAVIGGDIPYHEEWLITPGVIDHYELPAFVKSCGIGVAPIFSGSGTRLKILEYMAAGKPVVSTGKGAEGLNISDGHDILIADDADGFSSEIIKLLCDRGVAFLIGENGREFVASRYSWGNIAENFHYCLECLNDERSIS